MSLSTIMWIGVHTGQDLSDSELLLFYQVNVLLHLTLIRSLKDKQSQKKTQ